MNVENKKLNISNLTKIVGACLFIITYTVGVVSYLFKIEAGVTEVKAQVEAYKKENAIVQANLVDWMHNLDSRQKESETATKELTRIVDKTSVILERVERKLDSK